MKVTHLQSSTQIIEVGGTRVLTDPWLTEGEYLGSWFHYPPFEPDLISDLNYDFIYVSHIHPDHLSESTFKLLPEKKPVLIHNYNSKFVKRKIESFGFQVIECDHGVPFQLGDKASITIYAADNCDPEICGKFMGCGVVEKKFESTQIDTLAVFEDSGRYILNTNDCPYELAEKTIRANKLHELDVHLLLVGYAGAGPYPQAFEFDNSEAMRSAAEAKKLQFLYQAEMFIKLVEPATYAPFAGTYILGSSLAHLNEFRGVPSVEEAIAHLTKVIGSMAKGLHLQKLDTYDVDTGTLAKGNRPFPKTLEEYLDEISSRKLDYATDSWDEEGLSELVASAYQRFANKAKEIAFHSDTKIVLKTDKRSYIFGTSLPVKEISPSETVEEPFVQIWLEDNLLHRLIRGPRYAHWNNAEIGSHLRYLRKPDNFERGLYHALCFFHS